MRLNLTSLDKAVSHLDGALEYHGSDLASRHPAIKLQLRASRAKRVT